MLKTFTGLIVGICLSLLLVFFLGENPIQVFLILLKSGFASKEDFGITLYFATTFIFTGLAVSVPLKAGLFNIGGEGQMTVACFASAAMGILVSTWPYPIGLIVSSLAAILAGTLWGYIPGWLKSLRGSHEVIITMMLNFISTALTSWLTLSYFRSSTSQNPETTTLPDHLKFTSFDFVAKYFPNTPANLSLILAVILCFAFYFLYEKTVWGFKLKCVGENPTAADKNKIDTRKIITQSMCLAGLCAGLVSLNEVLGSSGKFQIGFSAEYGFVGIAVCMLARNNPLAIVLTAFFFALLQKGASDLALETQKITRDYARVIQAILILSVASSIFMEKWKPKGFSKKGIHGPG
jgi:ABC-type uncharacterized transport system permease subunit